MNNIVVASDVFEDRSIISGNVHQVQSIDGGELQYDTMTTTINLGKVIPTLFKPKGSDGLLTSHRSEEHT